MATSVYNITLHGKKADGSTVEYAPKTKASQVVMFAKDGTTVSDVDTQIKTLRTQIGDISGNGVSFAGVANAEADIKGEGTEASPLKEYTAGQQWLVKTAGTYFGNTCEVGDMILCVTSYAASTASDSDFIVYQSNIVGAVTNATGTSTDENLVVYSGTTGKVIKDSGFALSDLSTDHTKLAGIEAGADVTNATNVAASGAFMKDTDTWDSIVDTDTKTYYTKAEQTKLSGIEEGADVTDATNVAAAGAFMLSTHTTANITETDTKKFITDTQITKLAGIDESADVNQNAFSNVTVGTTTLAAASTMDTVKFVAGDGIALTPDATAKSITIKQTAIATTSDISTFDASGVMTGGLIVETTA